MLISNELLEDERFFAETVTAFIRSELSKYWDGCFLEIEFDIIHGDGAFKEYQEFLYGGSVGL